METATVESLLVEARGKYKTPRYRKVSD